MERLLEDAEKLSGVHYDISNYADIIQAIHVIQNEIGITGTTALEAADTIEGSLNSTKAAVDNLLTGFGRDDANIDELVENVETSLSNLAKNVMPVAERAFVKLTSTAISSALKAGKEIPHIISSAAEDVHQEIEKELGASANAIYGIESAAKAAAAAFVTYKAAAYTAEVVEGIKNVNAALKEGVTLTEAMNAANLANPYVLIATAAIGAGVAVKSLIDIQTDLIDETSNSYDLLNESQQETIDKQHELSVAVSESAQKWENSKATLESEMSTNNALIDRLYTLNEVEHKSKEQKAEMKAIVDKLNGSITGLNLVYDAQTDKLNKTRSEVDNLTESYVEQIQAQRNAERIVELLDKQSAAEKNLAEVQKQREGAQNKLNELNLKAASISAQMNREAQKWIEDGNGGLYIYSESYKKLAAEYETTTNAISDQKDVLGSLNTSYVQTSETIKSTTNDLEELGVTSDETADKIVEDANRQATEYAKATYVQEQSVLGFKKNAQDVAEISFKLGDNTVTLSETTAESVGKLIDTYDEMLASQKSAIMNSLDFFGGFEANADITYEEMMGNLSNVDFALNDWATAIEQLGEKGISQGLLDELREMGIKSYDYVRELNHATPDELKKYSDTWDKTHTDVNKVAEKQLSELKDQTEDAIMQIAGLPRSNMDEIKSSWYSVGVDANEGWAKGLEDSFGAVKNAVEDTGEGSIEAAMDSLDEHSPSKKFKQVGEFAAFGFAEGIIDGTGWAEEAARVMAIRAMEAVRDELQIHSPSKKTEQFGEFFSIGLAEGIENESETVAAAAKMVSSDALDALESESGTTRYRSADGAAQASPYQQQINIYLTEDSVEPFVSVIAPMLDRELGGIMNFKV